MNDDGQVIREIAAISGRDGPYAILHYLYAPSSEAANKIAEELKQRGFRTEQRLGADGVNWLVLARHEIVPTEELMASMRRSMETLIATVDGEYDGWETDVQNHVERAH
jgi:hypothetical protein